MGDEPTENTPNVETAPAPKMFDEDYVKSLRHEAAGYRAQVRELEEKAKLAETLERELGELKTRDERRIWAEEITKDSAIPPSVLRGETREEMQAHFDELLSIIPATPADAAVPADTETMALNSPGLESALLDALNRK